MIDYPEAQRVAEMIDTLCVSTRLRILFRLLDEPLTIDQLAESLHVKLGTIWKCIRVMRRYRLIEQERVAPELGWRAVYKTCPEVVTPGRTPDERCVLVFGRYRLVIYTNGTPVVHPSQLVARHEPPDE